MKKVSNTTNVEYFDYKGLLDPLVANADKTKKNVMISNNYPNKYISKIKISKTLKDIKERNNNIRNITSGKKDKIKLELINLTESQIVKDKKNKKIKTRNYISPMNKINTNAIKTLNKYKSYELIQSHKRKIKNEISEQLQKELINKLKNLRGEVNLKKTEKNEIFKKIKNIEKELDEIDLENYFSKEKYKRQIDDIVKKTMEDRKEEVIKNKKREETKNSKNIKG